MIRFNADFKETRYKDTVINFDGGFPIVYIGRGSYAENTCIHTYFEISNDEHVHLLYIGRYTSIADNLKIYCDMNHDHRSVYMGVICDYADSSETASFRERLGQTDKRMHRKGMTVIGNDVWIGSNVTLISDVVIGNGAVIGAESVITHDIPPYTIWRGNPAVCVGTRFSEDIINGLQKISWWDFSLDRLKEIESDMKGDVGDFVSKYEPLAADLSAGGNPLEIPNDLKTMVTFIDMESPYPVFCDVIEQFSNKYCDRSANLAVCYYKDSENDLMTMDAISDLIDELRGKANIYPAGIGSGDDEQVICHSNGLILGRDIKNIQRISFALKYGIKLISGVNRPIYP
ncbi:MAG: CatB-related O-acetyltransferase [Lachnospiraceae bacterium]|nr:CatB-related O-acetyltransferase [Lachnospiraceae bacterium]